MTKNELATLVVAEMRRFVAEQLAPVQDAIAELRSVADRLVDVAEGGAKRLEALEARPVPRDGKDVDPAQVAALVDEAVKALPQPRDGKDADPLVIVRSVLDLIPTPAPGRDGIGTREELLAVAREVVALELGPAVEAAVAEAVKALPKIEYRGVWSEGEYTKGQVTTWGGSGWICRVERSSAKPGTNEDWQLFVKRGRDR
jgi:hypothetical protein